MPAKQQAQATNDLIQSWDFYTPEISADPHPLLTTLRETGRAMWHDTYQAWIVPHHSDIVTILRDEKNFSAKDGIVAHNFGEFAVLAQDGPQHRALRRVWHAPFLKSALEKLTPEIREISTQLVEPAAEIIASGGSVDMAPINRMLPVKVIGRLLGVQSFHMDNFARWSDEITAMTGYALPADHPVEIRRAQAQQDITDLFREEISYRRQTSTDDLIGRLVSSGIEDQIGEKGLIDNLRLLLVAGNETTSNWFGNSMELFSRFPDIQAKARADRSLIHQIMEEFMRLETVVHFSFRRAATDNANVGGVDIPKGDQIIMVHGTANRDPKVWEHPDECDVHRDTRKHLGFGHGVHICMGKELAKLEGYNYFDIFFDLVPTYKVIDVDYALSFPLRGPQKLVISAAG